jgi:hypothetical protein
MTTQDSLSREQMGHLLANKPEGFSVRAFAPDVGENAHHGYMVAIEGHGQDYHPSASVDEGMDFVARREEALRKPEHYFGGYQGSDPERTALDVARKHPDTFSGHVAAGTQAMRLNQEAYGLLGEPDDYTDMPNPYYESGAGHHARTVNMEQMGTAIHLAGKHHPGGGIDSPVPSRSAELDPPSRLR